VERLGAAELNVDPVGARRSRNRQGLFGQYLGSERPDMQTKSRSWENTSRDRKGTFWLEGLTGPVLKSLKI